MIRHRCHHLLVTCGQLGLDIFHMKENAWDPRASDVSNTHARFATLEQIEYFRRVGTAL